jgi:hypothetical protein
LAKITYITDIFDSPLYKQFAEGSKRGGKSQFGWQAPYVLLDHAIEDYNNFNGTKWTRQNIFGSVADNDEHRSILDGALWSLVRNIPIYKEENPVIFQKDNHNIYTKLRLFNGLVDLCRFIELRIRHHEKPPKEVKTLGNLMYYVFEKETWFQKEIKPENKMPETALEFNNAIKKILLLKPPSKYVLLLWITRNYSVHVCDAEAPDFFDNIEAIFESIIGSFLFYLEYRKLL